MIEELNKKDLPWSLLLDADPDKEKVQDIIDNMRKGKYNNLIQEDIIRFLTGEGYRYINFTKEV